MDVKQIKETLKTKGIKSSVRKDYAGSDTVYKVTVEDKYFKMANEVLKQFDRADRCKASGEVLGGANEYCLVYRK